VIVDDSADRRWGARPPRMWDRLLMRWLLTDGTGPLYQAQGAPPLEVAVRDAIHRLDPSAEVLLP
jgi:hypothetical protein